MVLAHLLLAKHAMNVAYCECQNTFVVEMGDNFNDIIKLKQCKYQ